MDFCCLGFYFYVNEKNIYIYLHVLNGFSYWIYNLKSWSGKVDSFDSFRLLYFELWWDNGLIKMGFSLFTFLAWHVSGFVCSFFFFCGSNSVSVFLLLRIILLCWWNILKCPMGFHYWIYDLEVMEWESGQLEFIWVMVFGFFFSLKSMLYCLLFHLCLLSNWGFGFWWLLW